MILSRFVIMFLLFCALDANAQMLLFGEDFEGDLSQWIGQNSAPHSAVIVPDPFDASNQVVTFTQLTGLGDMYSPELSVIQGWLYVLRFDYLGQPGAGTPDNLGGFAGYAEDDIPSRGAMARRYNPSERGKC